MLRRIAVPLACLSLVAACGDDGPSIDPEADEELIEDALLTADDLPDGFVENPDVDDDDDENECNEEVLDIDPDELDENETAEAGPVEFQTEAGDVSVRAEIKAFRDTELPQQILEALDDDEYLECVQEGVVESLGPDGEVVGVEEIDSPVDTARAAELTFVVPDGAGGELEVVSQQHAALVDRFGITLQVTALAGELDEDLVEDALEAMIERIEEGQED